MALGAAARVGLIINPVAGMGGSVGLKGSDGELAAKARSLGAVPRAGERAVQAVSVLSTLSPPPQLLTCAGAMGAQAAEQAGFRPLIIYRAAADETAAADTLAAAAALLAADIDLLLFVGGDGTAREILAAVGEQVPVLGVPAGVKMHSAVFAATAKTAGDVAARYLSAREPARLLAPAEVMDREAVAEGAAPASPRLYGYLQVPQIPMLMQAAKASNTVSEMAALAGACRRVATLAQDGTLTLVGPGTTMQALKRLLGHPGTLLGVDAFEGSNCVAEDASEARLLELLDGRPARIVVTVIGGQGFLFGRGNQQLSAEVIRRVGRDRIIVIASQNKLTALPGAALRVDTGDAAVNRMLAGYLPVLTGSGRQLMCKVIDVDALATPEAACSQ
jgi:predicted polyphosphate/ATP-dependent NAD kinase